MKPREIETKIMSPLLGSTIPLPSRATDGSAALDLRACIDVPTTIQPGDTAIIPSGIAISIHDPALVAILAPRSGLGIRHGIVLANAIGVIDSDYQGEIMVGLRNQGEVPYTVTPGERICQMLFMPVVQADLRVVEAFSEESVRGSGGLGSTGKH
ncbi:dUTP diphosphatase [Trichlorobacter ammonificans]|uniref:Deoxyuridine 5'-triphosphate nucleotidohydrolase n=1 Tax=Trichlorobacter ammonificans TaxID=2916410 RepID=A0ABN8HLI0_9BACT|nr:dUTP diphosphatase [Trichlorobacter ammonificans]CAH2031795.1 deoxyuridine triphosphatase [Trichlorobacter ammonificans]